MSFWKQLPPKPGPALRKYLPILLSKPIEFEISVILAPVTSHNADIELIELILCAKKAFADNFDNSLLQRFVTNIFFSLIQFL